MLFNHNFYCFLTYTCSLWYPYPSRSHKIYNLPFRIPILSLLFMKYFCFLHKKSLIVDETLFFHSRLRGINILLLFTRFYCYWSKRLLSWTFYHFSVCRITGTMTRTIPSSISMVPLHFTA